MIKNKSSMAPPLVAIPKVLIVVAISWAFQGMHAYAESLPPPPPPTLEYKIIHSDLIVVAAVGPVMYMGWSESEGRYTGEMSNTFRKGSFPFFRLMTPIFLNISASTQRVIESGTISIVDLKSKPLWAHLGRCFPKTHGLESAPPTDQVRIFFLAHPVLASKAGLFATTCDFPALPLSDQSSIEEILRQSKPKAN